MLSALLIGLRRNCVIFGDEKGVISEMYISETTYYGADCINDMFSVTNKYASFVFINF